MSDYGQHWGAPDGGYGYQQPAAPPPVKKRNTGVIVGSIIGVAVLIMLICTGGFFGLKAMGDDDTANRDTATPASSRSSRADDSTSSSARPKATGKEISPAGSPYTFNVPSDFKEIAAPSEEGAVGTAASYRSAVAVSAADQKDFLIVTAYKLTADTDTYSDAAIAENFDSLVRKAGQDPSSREAMRVNGNRALKYEFDYGTSKAYSYFIFKGTDEVQLRCQWLEKEAKIKSGCDELLGTLTIV